MSRSEQSDLTKDAILNVSLQLFAKHGFEGTSIDEITKHAGITKGAIYWHFPDKKALFEAILATITARWREAVVDPVKKEESPTSKIEVLFDGYYRLFSKYPDICPFLQRVLLENDQWSSPQIGRLFSQTARFIARVIEEGKSKGKFSASTDSIVAGHIILGSLTGVTLQQMSNQALSLKSLIEEAKLSAVRRISKR